MASNPLFNDETGALEVARAYSAQIKGKIVLITGVSEDGIGEATARAFAAEGASIIIITGRDDSRLSIITTALSEDYPSVKFVPHKLDLTSLSSARASATSLLTNTTISRIDILVANAGGTFYGPKSLTPDGLETNLAVNHLGHFLFIQTLMPKLRAAAKISSPGDTRVVVVSSIVALVSPFRFADYNFDGKPLADDEKPNWETLQHFVGVEKSAENESFNEWIAYGQSKTANSLFAVHLNTLYGQEGINALTVHPGTVRSRGVKQLLGSMTKEQKAKLSTTFDKSIDQGGATILVAASDPKISPDKAAFLSDCQAIQVPEYIVSKEKAEKLWNLSEEIVAEKLQSTKA